MVQFRLSRPGLKAGLAGKEGLVCSLSFHYNTKLVTRGLPSPISHIHFFFFPFPIGGSKSLGIVGIALRERQGSRNWTRELEQPAISRLTAGVSFPQWSLIHNPIAVQQHYSHDRITERWGGKIIYSCRKCLKYPKHSLSLQYHRHLSIL